MANTFVTNKKTDLVALRAAEAAAYLTVGSKSYFKDQLADKRNGTSYEFVIRDAGEYATGVDMSNHVSNLVERKIEKVIRLGNILIDTNLLEKVTDVNWDREIAVQNGKKLINGVVKDTVDSDIGLQNTAFVGTGWMPLSKASRFLGSISSDKRYAFVDPMIDSVMAAGGKSFTPVDAEPLYKTGMLGDFSGTEFRESQFMPNIDVSAELANKLASATVSSIAVSSITVEAGTEYEREVAINVITLSDATIQIKKGMPIFIDGFYACDTVGDKTSSLAAFVAMQDSTGKVITYKKDFTGVGTREVCDADGKNIDISNISSPKLVNTLTAGNYFVGLFRIDGAMEFDTLDKLDWSNADATSDSVEGIKVLEGRAVDVVKGSNKTRWAVASLAGIVEPRACALVLVKDGTANLVAM